MDFVKINTPKTLTITIPTDPDDNVVLVSVTHDLSNDVIVDGLSAVEGPTKTFTITLGQHPWGEYILNSAGVHRVKFTYSISGVSYSQSQYIEVYTPYTTASDFFAEYPELGEYPDNATNFSTLFDQYEMRVRNIINTYCGQSFDFYPSKSITVDGNNHKNLHVPYPVASISKVISNYGTDDEILLHDSSNPTLNKIERVRQSGSFEASYYIRYRTSMAEYSSAFAEKPTVQNNKFLPKNYYRIEGDFGWRFVPSNVKQAAHLLLADILNDDSEFRTHGLRRVDMNTTKFFLNDKFYETTGNIEADVLLMDYTMFVMDYVV